MRRAGVTRRGTTSPRYPDEPRSAAVKPSATLARSGRLAQLARAPLLQCGGRGFETLNAHDEELVVAVFFVVVRVVGPAVAAEQLPAAAGTPLHVAAEVVEAARADAAVVAAQRRLALCTRWSVGESFVALACQLDEASAAGCSEEHLPVAVVTHHHGPSMTQGCDTDDREGTYQ
jgi:hypothetical protein